MPPRLPLARRPPLATPVGVGVGVVVGVAGGGERCCRAASRGTHLTHQRLQRARGSRRVDQRLLALNTLLHTKWHGVLVHKS